MRKAVLVVVGVVIAIAGAVWALQGLGVIGGSFMSGATVWAVIGPVVALAGLAIAAVGLPTRTRAAGARWWMSCRTAATLGAVRVTVRATLTLWARPHHH